MTEEQVILLWLKFRRKQNRAIIVQDVILNSESHRDKCRVTTWIVYTWLLYHVIYVMWFTYKDDIVAGFACRDNSILANWLFFIIICIHNPFWKIIYLCFLFRVLSIVFHNPWAMETIRTWKLFERSYSTSELHNRTIQYNCTIYSTVVLHNRTIQYNCTTVQYSSIAQPYNTVQLHDCTVQ